MSENVSPNTSSGTDAGTEVATLGGGCFWCIEAVFDQLNGVKKVVSGYEGGEVPNPTYQQVCTGSTGHAEVIEVHFDPDVVSFADILRVFFTVHDPTTLNRQGADVGTQYRSVIFYHDDEQKRTAEAVMTEIDAKNLYPNPIVTELAPHDTFYPAESYHQDYYQNNRAQPYCQFVIAPKVAKFRKAYVDKLAV
ncbi:MAG: peptide-methionine (S)-S-oxide reductase MsrA [Trueperaceae bacterium]|nr:peptide-methionine (S)-S-oxide reductase MsrA [Trueperaceae bacterium]